MYVIWITMRDGRNGYFVRFNSDGDDYYYNTSIHEARKFPSYGAASSIKEKLDRLWDVDYTEIIEQNNY